MAQVRAGQAAAQTSSRSTWITEARTRTSPSSSSAALIATAVRGLMRIHTDHHRRHDTPSSPNLGKPWRARLIPGLPAGARTSFEPRHGEAPAGWHVVRKPDPKPAGRRLKSQPHRDLSTLRARLTAIPARPATP